MMKIKISADSTCDLSPELISEYDITIVPLYIIRGTQSFKDGIEITPEDVFEYVDSGAGICSTASVNEADYIEVFSALRKEYDAVIHFNISSEMSSGYANASRAAAEVGGVFVIDSANLSTGIGLLIIKAAEMAQCNVPIEEIQLAISAYAKRVESSFVIDTLRYLYKGGRCSALASLGANLLKLKPCIEVHSGKMCVGKKYRGSFSSVIMQYVRDRLFNREDIDKRYVFLTSTVRTPKEITNKLHEMLREFGFERIMVTNAGCTISCHCGPVCLGILFLRK